ncbi:MAG: ATP-binding protein [Bacteroidetes bacterium]|nr:ATP-binding protein [Bacteroidota bacterium]
MSIYIKNLISEGEHLQLDFKFEISDSKKIARSLVAFANTNGGRLLVGVKDNGVIAGVRSDEEYFMVEGAASMYCKPEVKFKTKEWHADGKLVLEIIVEKSSARPHYAPDREGNWKVFIRVGDQNLLANKVLLQVWKHQKNDTAVKIRYKEQEEILMHYLLENRQITLSRFSSIAGIPRFLAEKILLNFILLDIISMDITEKQTYYRLSESRT